MIEEFLKQAGLTLLVTILFAPLIWWMNNRLEEIKTASQVGDFANLTELSPNAVASFMYAILAAAVWGLSNAVTRYSAAPFQSAVFEIAFIQFVGGTLSVFLIGHLKQQDNDTSLRAKIPKFLGKWHILSAVVMAINTYAFALGVSLVSAGTIATLENMQVVWIAFILTFVLATKVPVRWAFSSVIVLIGAIFITNFPETITTENDETLAFGYVLGIVAGLTFAIYTLLWSKARSLNSNLNFKDRSLELAVMLGLSTILLIPLHGIYSLAQGQSVLFPFTTLPFNHVLIQFGIGVTSLGLTYILINEALELLSGAGRVRALLVGLGISYAVFFTLIFEFFIFGQNVSFQQWSGVVLFSLGFMMVWRDIHESV